MFFFIYFFLKIIFKMSKFEDCSNEIIGLLDNLTNNQLKVLFGDTKRFKNWLINNKIKDVVSNN